MLKNLVGDLVPVASIDEAIVSLYPEFDVPVDEILRDPAVTEEFVRQLTARMGLRQKLHIPTVNLRLLTLRKRGEANGGLPRLQRDYNGRTVKPR
jgi:hypothetical protein